MDLFANLHNMPYLLEGMSWLFISFLVAMLITAWLMVVAKANFWIRFLAIPIWLVFSISMLVAIDRTAGYAYPAKPTEGELINYLVLRDPNSEKKIIEIWIYHSDIARTRLYRFPYTPEADEELHNGMRLKGEESRVMIKRHSGMKDSGVFEVHEIPHFQLPSKG